MRLGIRDGGIGKVGERGRFGRGRTVLHVLLAKSKRRRFGFDFGFGFDLHCDCGVSSWACAFWPCQRVWFCVANADFFTVENVGITKHIR